jgi:hypothetical protein
MMGPDADTDIATEQVENFGGLQEIVGGRKRGSKRSKNRGRKTGRGRKGGTFLAEISVPVALLAATQYMKSRRGSYGKSRRRGSKKSYRNKSVRRRR